MAKSKASSAQVKVNEPEQLSPTTAAEYMERAWLFYSRKKYNLSEKDFETALETEPDNVEAVYGLALVLKSSGENARALSMFEKALALLETLSDRQRVNILGRLIRGQINQIKTGDWNLEKEVWQTVH